MSSFAHRYARDPSRPTVRQALGDFARRSLPWGVLLWVAIVGVGLVLTGPLRSFAASEDDLNRALQAGRTPLWDTVTMVWSRIGNTEIIIATCLVVSLLIWWRTKQWWYAVTAPIAISLQATIFVIATAITDRPRPDVERLDPAPPTSSYPSGHVGASFALYCTFALMAQRIANPALRRVVTGLLLVVPFLVFYARLYRGMHHLIDCIVGLLNGVICAALAWRYLRRLDG